MRLSALLLALTVLPLSAAAQSFTPVREQKNLSPAGLAKLHTLEELNALPPGDWRFHAGDIPHGESPTLDDSSWQLIPAPTGRTGVKASREAVWYRREITVPRTVAGYDITGSTITFQFHADANGPMPEIIYFNGRRVALGDDLEPIILAQPAHPGDRILVAVKLLHTVDDKTFRGVTLQITPAADSHRPSPNDLRVECLSSADLLPALPHPRRDLLPRVEAAVAAIDTQALAHADQTAFDASLRKSQAILDELHPVVAEAHITEDGNSHIDAAWLWPRSETIDVVRRTFTTALQLMDEYPDYVFTQSAAQYSEWMADKYPDLNAQIKQRIQQGRWEIVGGMWVEPDLNLPSGESQVRQLLVGQRFFQKEYGVTARIGWNPDSFGYNWQLPQIYKRSGLDYFVTQKMHWNDTNQLPFRLFWWESPDGSKVLTYFPTDYVHANLNPTRVSADFAESADRNPGTTHMLDLYGIGDHGGGPTRAMLDEGDHWMALENGSQPPSADPSSNAPSPPERTPQTLSSRPERTAQTLSSPPERTPQTLSSRPEREARSGETPVFRKTSVEATSPAHRSPANTPAFAAALPTQHYGTPQTVSSRPERTAQTLSSPPERTPQTLSSRPEREARSGETPVFRKTSVEATSPTHRSPANTPAFAAALPTQHYGTAQSYFNDVEKHLNPDSPTWNYDKLAEGWHAPPAGPNGDMGLPTWNDELYFEFHRGVYTTQAKHKENIRKSEVATLDTEKLASLAWLAGKPYPADELTDNWKKITFNQFHDLAAGSGIAVIYRDAQKDFTQVFRSDREMTAAAVNQLDAAVDTRVKTGVPVVLYNALAWPRSETVPVTVQLPASAHSVVLYDETNSRRLNTQLLHHDDATQTFTVLADVHDVPALGYKVLRAIPAAVDPNEARATKGVGGPIAVSDTPAAFTILTSKLALVLDKRTGCITSLKDSQRHEFLAPGTCGNQLQTYVDKPRQYDAWNIDPGTLDGPMTPISQVESIRLLDVGETRATVRIQRTWQSSHFTEDISLDAYADFVRIDTTVDWHETHVLLKAAFPLAASSQKATFEIPYGTIERPTTRNNSFEKAKFEVPALRWADLGDEHQGVSILNDSKYGYDALGNTLRLTLLRSPIWPDPDADRGLQRFSYAIYPHAGTWKQADTVRRGYEFNDPLTATQVFAHTGALPSTHSFAAVDEKNVVLTAVKKAEDTDALIFRMVEYNGAATEVHLHIPPGATYAVETNLMEKPEATHLPLANDTITVPIKPYEILTLSVAYPHAGR